MRYKAILLLVSILALATSVKAQETRTVNDTIYNPKVVFSGHHPKYEIAGIKVTGADNYEDYIIIGYSGLSIGQRVEIPGEDIKNAAKRFWRQGLFSKVQIKVEKVYGDKAWLEFDLQQQPRISQVNYLGMKGGEKKDVIERLGLTPGNQMTPNIADRVKIIVQKYFADKGFDKATVEVIQKEDLSKKNEVIVDIVVDKHSKIGVHKIYIDGNEVLSDGKIKGAMKKTNETGFFNFRKWFSQKKFVATDYDEDKNRIIEKYNELGYRDARIVSDSVVAYSDNKVDVHLRVEEGKKYYISGINWVGNTVYPTEYLENVLGMEKGQVYNQKKLNKRLSTDDDAVSNLYLDKGYLFAQIVPVETHVEGDSIALEMRLFEGKRATINRVVINGNDRLYEKVIRRELRVRPGDLFSKSDLMRSAREIAQTGHFDPEKMDIRPEPNEENGTVDIIFGLESKANDQVEFSAGWGQTGIIGKLSLKFTNFSLANLLHPGENYRGILPQGDGQTLTISGQTNAKYYQSYSISFFDPWFGGKRPNSLSVSAFFSVQTDISSRYYNSSYFNNYYNSMYSGYGGYGMYNYGNYNNYENYYDPDKSIKMWGLSLGWGKRLKWPDDYFTLSAELAYQRYNLKDWQYFPVTNGKCNDLSISLTLARNSIDNPIFPRSGSDFSLSVQFTPPYSAFDGKDYKGYYSNPKTGSITQDNMNKLHKWVEYHKWKFKGKTYTPLMDPIAHPKCLVLMTRTEFGLLGHYNEYKKSPFGTFDVGGDGMTGYSSYATESIALRGYENSSLTPYGSEGYAYTRLGIELRYPLMLETSTNIYVLGFLEAGNAWNDIKKFNPFDLKRSAGVGVRIFLPMIGMMGIDWGYGFDKVFGSKQYGGSQFHFILGQEF